MLQEVHYLANCHRIAHDKFRRSKPHEQNLAKFVLQKAARAASLLVSHAVQARQNPDSILVTFEIVKAPEHVIKDLRSQLSELVEETTVAGGVIRIATVSGSGNL